MKKKYVKPEMFFEDFSLTTSIAAGCETQTKLPSLEALCGYKLAQGALPLTLFTNQVGSQCTWKIQEPTDSNGEGFITNVNGTSINLPCYHNPSDTNNLFNS